MKDNNQQMDHKVVYMCISEQVSHASALFLMQFDGIVSGMMDGGLLMNSLHSTHQFSEPWNNSEIIVIFAVWSLFVCNSSFTLD